MKKLLSLILAVVFCVVLAPVAEASITVDVTDDGYHFEHPGGDGWVWSAPFSKSYNQHSDFDAYGVMNFDIEGALAGYTVNDIVSAELKFYVTDKQGNGPDPYPAGTDAALNIKVYSWEEPEWSEYSTAMPTYYADSLEITQSHTTGFNVWETVDFTEIVKTWLVFGADNGIEIWEGVPDDDYGLYWNSREAGEFAPYLDVTVVPEPVSLLLLGTGLMGLLGFRRRKL